MASDRRIHEEIDAPLTMKATIKQQINHISAPEPSMLKVHNNYIDAEQIAYEEVASAISNKDDPDMLCLTFRVWFIGLLFAAVNAFINQYFWYTSHHEFGLSSGPVILLSFLIGQLFALILPRKCWTFGSRFRFSLNPGPFTFKEHILIFVMYGTSSQNISLSAPFDVKRLYYLQKPVECIVGVIFCASLYLMVFGIAGIMRRFLVWPSSLIWPENLTNIILIRTLNDRLVDGSPIGSSASKREISRLNFFIFAMICQCAYFWLPSYIMPILQSFAWLCWINPNNLLLSQLTGIEGFGIGSLTFDWLSINNLWNSPIIVPLWAKINILIGFVSIVWILSPLSFYTNFLELHYSPIRILQVLRSKGYAEDFNNYIDPSTFLFNETKYKLYVEEVGEIRLSVALVLQLGFGLLLVSSVIVHTILYHGHDILKQVRTSASNRNNDIHCFLMSQYTETPEWWFIIVFILSLISTILVCVHNNLMEWYHVLLSVVVGWILILPFGIIRANTGLIVIKDVIALYVGSLILHNKPMSILTFRLTVFYLQTDGLTLVSNLKLCHYAKIPSRTLFMMLICGRLVAAVVGYAVGNYLLTNIKGICHDTNTDWNCSMLRETMATAVGWASTGPRIWFSGIYKPLFWLLLIGGILPIPFWLLRKRYSKIIWLKYVHIPIMLMPAVYWYVTPSASTFTWLILGLLFHLLIHRWWYERYSLLFSAAMDAGATISGAILFFVFINNDISFPDWWGTRIDDKCPMASPAWFPM